MSKRIKTQMVFGTCLLFMSCAYAFMYNLLRINHLYKFNSVNRACQSRHFFWGYCRRDFGTQSRSTKRWDLVTKWLPGMAEDCYYYPLSWSLSLFNDPAQQAVAHATASENKFPYFCYWAGKNLDNQNLCCVHFLKR